MRHNSWPPKLAADICYEHPVQWCYPLVTVRLAKRAPRYDTRGSVASSGHLPLDTNYSGSGRLQ